MRYLLDTHTFLWFSEGSRELSDVARYLMADQTNELFVSMASLWEISIKASLGKLTISSDYISVIDDITGSDMTVLPINFAHLVVQNQLPFHHRDPFDRLLISQAIAESMSIISRDRVIDAYLADRAIKRIW